MIVSLREKGRITIPVSIRRALGLRVGDKLHISIENGAIILKPEETIKAEDIRGVIGPVKVKIEEVEEAFGRDLS